MHIMFALLIQIALAQPSPCPSLAGTWHCNSRQGGGAPFQVKITEQTNESGVARYTVQTPVEGITELTADAEARPVNPQIGEGTQRSTCENGKLQTTFHLNSTMGPATTIIDYMYPERGGLVRIFRQVEPSPGPRDVVPSFSCKPDIPSRRR